jgi:hypothetical protein
MSKIGYTVKPKRLFIRLVEFTPLLLIAGSIILILCMSII